MQESIRVDTSLHETRKIQALLQFEKWFTQHGGVLHPAVEFAFKPDSGYFLRVKQLSEDNVRTTLPLGSIVISCPHALTLSALDIVGQGLSLGPSDWVAPPVEDVVEQLIERDARPQCLGGIALAAQLALADASPWDPYIKLLPVRPHDDTIHEKEAVRDGELDSPVWWSSIARSDLAGTALEKGIEDLVILWQCEWDSQVRAFQNKSKHNYFKKVTFADYKWAMTVLNSRAFSSSQLSEVHVVTGKRTNDTQRLLDRYDPRMLLYPGVDLLNHSAYTKNYWIRDHEKFGIVCDDEPGPGQEVFNSYGSKTNAQLLLSWGFVIPNNPHDGFPLKLSTKSSLAIGMDHLPSTRLDKHAPVELSNGQPRQRFPNAVDLENSVFYIRRLEDPVLLAPGYCSEYAELAGAPSMLLSHLAYEVANYRERMSLEGFHQSSQLGIYVRAGQRNRLAVVAVLYMRLIHEWQRLVQPSNTQTSHTMPLSTREQERRRLVATYRIGQQEILESNLAQFSSFLAKSMIQSLDGIEPGVLRLGLAIEWLRAVEAEAAEAFGEGLEALYGSSDLDLLRGKADELDMWALWLSLGVRVSSHTSSHPGKAEHKSEASIALAKWFENLSTSYSMHARSLCNSTEMHPTQPTNDMHFGFAMDIGTQIAEIYSKLYPRTASSWWEPPASFLQEMKDEIPQRKRRRRDRDLTENIIASSALSLEGLVICAITALDESLVLDSSVWDSNVDLGVRHGDRCRERVLFFETRSASDND